MNRFVLLFAAVAVCAPSAVSGASPAATDYTFAQCAGSAMPYAVPPAQHRAVPDSLRVVYIDHVGRHGARYLSSGRYTGQLLRWLDGADSLGTITPRGRRLRNLCRGVDSITAGRWGALDPLGADEQCGLARRMYWLAPWLFGSGCKVQAVSSYVPRCVASMDEFTHQLCTLGDKVGIYTSSGPQNNPLVRPWTDDAAYSEYIGSDGWRKVYEAAVDETVPAGVAASLLGKGYPLSEGEARDVAMAAYKVVSGCAAMGIDADASAYFTRGQYNALWSVQNLHHYLTRSASMLSTAAVDVASGLLLDLVNTLSEAAAGSSAYTVNLRFGHAETMMPLLALMRLAGCYYITDSFDTVGMHWRDFHVVPMACNLQLLLLRSATGRLYVRADLNEVPVPLIPGRDDVYTPWPEARDYMLNCLPASVPRP